MDLKAREKAAFAAFIEQIQTIDFKPGQVKPEKDRIAITYSDGTRILIQLSTVTADFGKGEFGASVPLLIYDGPIYRILTDNGLEQSNAFPNTMILRYSLAPKPAGLGFYEFRTSTDVEALMKKIMKGVRQVLVPIIEQFTGKYGEAVDFILAHNGAPVRRPFAMCLILLGLSNTWDRLDEVVDHAKKTEGFWDYHQSPDQGKSLIKKVRTWFEKNKQPGKGK